MRKRRKLLIVGLLLWGFLLQTGCEFKDIDKRFFITAIGVDKPERGDKKYRVSLKIAIPKGQLKMGQEDFLTLSMDSNSITNAIQELKARVDKEFDFGHTKVLVLGDSLAKRDYRDPLDWFSRQRFIQRVAWMMVGEPSAEALLNAKQKSERLPANALILAFGGQGVQSQYIVSQYLFEFFRKSQDSGETPILACAAPASSGGSDYYTIDHLAVFDQKKLVFTLTPEETKYYNVLSSSVEKSDYMVPVQNNIFTIHANTVRVKKRIVEGANPAVEIRVNIDGVVEEEKLRSRITEARLVQIKRALAQSFATGATAFLTKMQKSHLDPVGYGALYRAQHWDDLPTEMRNWQRLYPKVKFHVQVDCDLRSPGTIE